MQKFRNKKIRIILLIMVLLIIGVASINKIYLKSNKQESKNQNKNLIAKYIQNPNGEYELSNTKKFPIEGYLLNTEKSSCKNGSRLSQNIDNKTINLTTTNREECTLYFDKIINKVLNHLNLKTKEEEPDFTQGAITDETRDGLYGMKDDYGVSYYYRGAVNNNYVKFEKNANGQDMWWRIIRFNGNGTIRIIYNGTKAHTNQNMEDDCFAIRQSWNTLQNDAKYVGYMFGGTQGEASTSYEQATKNETDSDMKKALDNWYELNIKIWDILNILQILSSVMIDLFQVKKNQD